MLEETCFNHQEALDCMRLLRNASQGLRDTESGFPSFTGWMHLKSLQTFLTPRDSEHSVVFWPHPFGWHVLIFGGNRNQQPVQSTGTTPRVGSRLAPSVYFDPPPPRSCFAPSNRSPLWTVTTPDDAGLQPQHGGADHHQEPVCAWVALVHVILQVVLCGMIQDAMAPRHEHR